MQEFSLFVANEARTTNNWLNVTNKYSHEVAARVAQAGAAELEQAIQAATDAAPLMRKLASYQRKAILDHTVARCRERAEELAYWLCIEAGKPINDARGEVGRLIDTLQISAEEAIRINGEMLPLDIAARARNYRGMTQRVPIGPCAFISPFNFPLNLVAHKIGPAIASGCPFILKPASLTPVSALILGEILAETELPKGAFSILPLARNAADQLVMDDRLKLLSFTGSAEVGWDLKARAGKKPVILELGGNAACIIEPDANLDDVIKRLVIGAFYQSGQSCISVQRVLVHDQIYDEVKNRFVAATQALIAGDPLQPNTFIGPLIQEKEAERLERWIVDAVQRGARLLCGGTRQSAVLDASILENVPVDSPLCAEEAFGPVAVLERYTDFDEVIERVNQSRYGLQAGIFTRDLYKAMKAWDELDVGGVIVGDVPSWRVDHMPYGGVKDSGIGREGVRYAIEHMTEPRLLVIREA